MMKMNKSKDLGKTPKTIEELNAGFIWTADQALDNWHVMRADETGKFRGDCDDYAATFAYIESGSSWPRFWWRTVMLQHVFWWGRTRGNEDHVLLWVRGKGWVDNTNPVYGKLTLRVFLPIPFFIVAFQLAHGKFQAYLRSR
jgi:hypothetical protein|tara:strand:+ start:115 stop:540 length:426 start_codon:yes stop_codon:yes gene_type:complete